MMTLAPSCPLRARRRPSDAVWERLPSLPGCQTKIAAAPAEAYPPRAARNAGSARHRAGERAAQLPAGADVELGEDLVQVVLDGARADEQLRADLRVRLPLGGEAGDLLLLGREDVACLGGAPGHGLAGGRELTAGALGERLGPGAGEGVVGRPELLARRHTPVLAAEPLAVEQLGAGELDQDPGALEPLDRLAVERLGHFARAEQRARPG